MQSSPLIKCNTITTAEKHKPIYSITIEDGDEVQRRFNDFEKLYEKVRQNGFLSNKIGTPPKKKFLQADTKLLDKRKLWVEQFTHDLVLNHSDKEIVQKFFGMDTFRADDIVCLGSSERKNARPSDFDFLKTIGKGSFGRVYLVRHRTDRKLYAMKVMGKEHIKKRNEVKHIMAERNVLISNINHPFLVALHYSFQTKDKLYFVLDYLNGGELFFHLQKERHFSEARSRFYAAEIGSALGYLHDNNIIYRDLKPENLLLDRSGHVILTDFGLCKENMHPSDTTETFCGTPEYLAPEILLKKPYDRTVDWWCLGSVLFEMLVGLPPFYSKDRAEMYERILHQKLVVPPTATPTCKDILNKLLHKDCEKRLGSIDDFREIKSHSFFTPIDFDKLQRKELKPPFIPKIKDDLDVSQIDREFTSQQPNQASLIPATFGTQRDSDFLGFSYVS
ncbi:Serine/threonine-protein kinase sgk-1 [Toxocara canis]|uniref:Serine/threonine-protein kinase sgk-1 n=1 Tax=Toxocara canis TaxID=6265 RepID=A0A0B2VFZ9_TOXCA|nr:Serine/threonine-protein kinase sgk-1 [Toxocara canis]